MKRTVYPEVVSGYELNQRKGFFSVLEPEERINYCDNPSLELDDTGWDAYPLLTSPTAARTALQQRRGSYSYACTTDNALSLVFLGVAYNAFIVYNTNVHVFSFDFLGNTGTEYACFASPAALSSPTSLYGPIKRFKATGEWQRIDNIFTAHSGTLTSLMVIEYRSPDGYTGKTFYVDGMQAEEGTYPTTYFDGDSRALITKANHFNWDGLPHASISWRSGESRAGGVIRALKDYGMDILEYIGLGKQPEEHVAIPLGLIGGSQYQRTLARPRDYSIVGAIAKGSYYDMRAAKEKVSNLFTQENVSENQPIIVRMQDVNDCGDPVGDPMHLPSLYGGGLEDTINNLYQDRFAITLTMPQPQLLVDGEQGGNVDGTDVFNIIEVYYSADRNKDTTGTSMWSETDDGLNDQINTICEAQDGDLYYGGLFTQIKAGGGVNAYRVCRYDVREDSFERIAPAMGTGLNGEVRKIIAGPNNIIYIGGLFDDIQGGPGGTYPHVIQYTPGAAFSALGAGLPSALANGQVFDLFIDPTTGYLWAAHTVDSGANLQGAVSYWNGAAWVLSKNWGTDIYIYSIVIDQEGTVWAGGEDASGAGPPFPAVFQKLVAGGAWADAGSAAIMAQLDYAIFCMTIGDDGVIYLGGSFTDVYPSRNVAGFNGVNFILLGDGCSGTGVGNLFYKNGELYASGAVAYSANGAGGIGSSVKSFTTSGNVIHYNSCAKWNGSSWTSVDFALNPSRSGTTYMVTTPYFLNRYNNAFIGIKQSGAASNTLVRGHFSTVLDVDSISTTDTYPIIEFYSTVAGWLIWVRNETTDETIYLYHYLSQYEYATLNLETKKFTSRTKGNIINDVIPGSDLAKFHLKPGLNRITYFFWQPTGTVSASKCRTWMQIRHNYSGGALY